MSLFDKLGGQGAISAVVDKFYEFLLEDQQVSHFFASIDMAKQACRQKQFITLVTGGPHNYEGATMKTAHCKLDISKTHFDITWCHLQRALNFYNVPVDLVIQVKNIFYSVQSQIVKEKIVESTLEASTVQKQFVQVENVNEEKSQKISGCPFRSQNNSHQSEVVNEVSNTNSGECPFRSKVNQQTQGKQQSGNNFKLNNNKYLKHVY